MRVGTFKYKLAGMRKADEFIVYPRKDKNALVKVQGDRTIGIFDPVTRKGLLNWKGSNHKYGVHLNKALGAEEFEFPAEFVMLALNFAPAEGDEIGPGVYIGKVT